MNRRNAAVALLLGPLGMAVASVARAQQPGRVYHIGYLSAPTRDSVEHSLVSFLEALRRLGWIEGRNLLIEYRWAEGQIERLPEFAADLVARNVDLIVAPAGSAALAAKNATSTIPIVMIFPRDPVEAGLVASLRRPGGNVTGTTFSPGPEIVGKELQILREAVPQATRLAFLWNPAEPGLETEVKTVEGAARSLGIHLQHVEARGPEDFSGAFASMARERTEAVLVGGGSTFLANRTSLAELATKARLPTMYGYRENVEAGGLMAYGVKMSDFIARAAMYVDRILKGAKPADLPVEQPTKFELIVNLTAAKALGITIPKSLLLRADEVIP